jgi:hypothetical protein
MYHHQRNVITKNTSCHAFGLSKEGDNITTISRRQVLPFIHAWTRNEVSSVQQISAPRAASVVHSFSSIISLCHFGKGARDGYQTIEDQIDDTTYRDPTHSLAQY